MAGMHPEVDAMKRNGLDRSISQQGHESASRGQIALPDSSQQPGDQSHARQHKDFAGSNDQLLQRPAILIPVLLYCLLANHLRYKIEAAIGGLNTKQDQDDGDRQPQVTIWLQRGSL